MAMTLQNWWFVLPSLTLLAAPACGGDGGATTGTTGTDGTTEPGTTDGTTTTGSTGQPGNPSSPATSETPTTDGTTLEPTTATTDEPATVTTEEPGTTTTTEPGTTTSEPGTTTDTTTGTTGPVEPGPDHIPEIPDDGMPSSAHFKKIPLGMSDATQGFWEYTPPGYGGGEKYPLLVFLHGIGENGNGDSELDKVPNGGGPPRLQKNNQWDTTLPFVVLSPQHPGGGCPGPGEIHSFIEFAMTHYDVNPARVYLTGLSCGAIGSWGYLGDFLDEQIVAMVPIAGDGKGAFNKAKCELGRVPIWAFHGDADPTVNVSGTIVPVEGLQACDPKPDVEMVIYPGTGHDSWSKTYDLSAGHDIYSWLLERYKQ
ncbi:hypothetical protein [Nannocystis bainbridge]|uniref:Phospholipase/carboxylesterase/thioesterase domain-containing protein n=1 Tax=Nannocystis bainbridge TaxID=2995303 RepID=A0ABT5E3D9_9BACT|nr:hypothetical protein [Nannocystis bainbridge]MDC0720385.1 hypothetical protein [Nannocystis bainbridge]